MEEEKKRWTAMYTKHIKQKRKVYHDGFLDLHFNRKKVMLYDEAGNLLGSRMLRAGEVVNSGETLTFEAYLVDICDPEEGSKVSSDPKVQQSDQGCTRKSFAVLKPNFKKSSLHREEKIPKLVNTFSSKCLSPSQKMIRVFKKRELHRYEARSPDSVNPIGKGTSGADSRLENDKLSKDITPHKPLRDVNQILSILKRKNVAETCSDNNLQTSVSSTKVPIETDNNKRHKMESVLTKAASTDLHRMVQETTSTKTSGCLMTRQLNDPPSFDLGI